MSNWTYQFIVCSENVTGNEHYLFTIKDEDTCLLVTDENNKLGDSTFLSQLMSLIEACYVFLQRY